MKKGIINLFFLAIALLLFVGTLHLAQAMTDTEARNSGNKLLQELESFKDAPVFKKYGFNKAKGNPGPEWLAKVQKLKSQTTNVDMGLSFSIMFLEDLGKAYFSGNTEEINKYTKSIGAELNNGQQSELTAQQNEISVTGHPLAVKILDSKEYERNGRNRLTITIIPAQDQSKATQADLAATAVAVATTAHQNTKAPIVTVNMKCQQAANGFGELQLAYVVYVPDGLGMDGKTPGKVWESLDAAPRGFTKQELQYLRLGAEMRAQFKDKNDELDENKLKAAIAKKMGIKPGSLQPHMNMREPVKGTLNIDGELKIVQ